MKKEENVKTNMIKYNIVDSLEYEFETIRDKILGYNTNNDITKLLLFAENKVDRLYDKMLKDLMKIAKKNKVVGRIKIVKE